MTVYDSNFPNLKGPRAPSQNCQKNPWLGYGADGCFKVLSLRLGFAMKRLQNSLCQPKWVPFFELGKDKAAKGEEWALSFHLLCPRDSGTLTLLPLRLSGYGTPLPFKDKGNIDVKVISGSFH